MKSVTLPRVGLVSVLLTGFMLSGCAATPSPSPVVTPSRISATSAPFVGTQADYVQALVSCMSDDGWEGSVTGPDSPEGAGAINWSLVPEEQDEAWNKSMQDCLASLGKFTEAAASPEQVQAQYDKTLAQYNCLVDANYTPATPPSFATFADAYATSGAFNWDPIADLPSSDYFRALEDCPRP